MNINTAFTRALLAQITPDVRRLVKGVKLRDAWTGHAGRDVWEFHYKKFYWHGHAEDAYEARYKGWAAYLASIGAVGYKVSE